MAIDSTGKGELPMKEGSNVLGQKEGLHNQPTNWEKDAEKMVTSESSGSLQNDDPVILGAHDKPAVEEIKASDVEC
ncbi:hypothetical protein GUJ93_ZPchr0006g42348 [Zizania palustris]|uniref:Uncharacterized protein n=1 Tax=Zizania palustris TaxID=103762 RepID=A0A8J5W311_ZIZPA|nr:hypothetical protein GUJ93_ZPchr0006g42348 [Zizania palustris]